MATSFTYAALKSWLKDSVEDQGTAFDSAVDTIIKLGEDRILKDLPLSIFDLKAQNVSIVQGQQTATKPTDAILIHELYYVSAGVRYHLLPRVKSWIDAVCTDSTERAPRWFDESYSETQIYIGPVPNLTVTALADITKRPASIVSASTTWLGTNLGDLLFASCMIDAERYNLGWAEAKDWNAEYIAKLEIARVELRHILRRGYATLAPQPQAAGKGER
jgi:hypothetical protein